MKNYKFYTNIKCGACEAKIRSAFAQSTDIQSFTVDLQDPNRPLEVVTNDSLSQQALIQIIEQAGYEAKPQNTGFFKSIFG
jgi:copper chaperone